MHVFRGALQPGGRSEQRQKRLWGEPRNKFSGGKIVPEKDWVFFTKEGRVVKSYPPCSLCGIEKQLTTKNIPKGGSMVRIIFLFVSLFSSLALAEVLDVKTKTNLSVTELAATIEPGQILTLSESHALKAHPRIDQDNQIKLLMALLERDLEVFVGLEFIDYTAQSSLANYLIGNIDEDDFLKEISWGDMPFDAYREQLSKPLEYGYFSYGINLPRKISSKIYLTGLESLTEEERAMLPSDFQLGNDNYRERFYKAMRGHGDPALLNRAFTAQSAWDDTMANTTARILEDKPEAVFIIIVGYFHTIYGDGLVERLQQRTGLKVTNILQTTNAGATPEDKQKLAQKNEKYGFISDYIW